MNNLNILNINDYIPRPSSSSSPTAPTTPPSSASRPAHITSSSISSTKQPSSSNLSSLSSSSMPSSPRSSSSKPSLPALNLSSKSSSPSSSSKDPGRSLLTDRPMYVPYFYLFFSLSSLFISRYFLIYHTSFIALISHMNIFISHAVPLIISFKSYKHCTNLLYHSHQRVS